MSSKITCPLCGMRELNILRHMWYNHLKCSCWCGFKCYTFETFSRHIQEERGILRHVRTLVLSGHGMDVPQNLIDFCFKYFLNE